MCGTVHVHGHARSPHVRQTTTEKMKKKLNATKLKLKHRHGTLQCGKHFTFTYYFQRKHRVTFIGFSIKSTLKCNYK